ncbi:hypothetical protein [Enterococcus thailandicus]|uniref:hypothetical protein n=1 Tax=Enterococcus thailandicus TaxID=417368 RepID=UPI0022E29C51|nr:hypothetical protein [Enterococcus thailandicus]
MDKYKVLKVFVDVHTKETYKVGQEIDLTEERFDEIEKNLEAFGGGFLEPIKIEGKQVKKPTKSTKSTKKKG